MTALQSLLPADSPWLLRSIWDINNNGQIVGVAYNWDTETFEAVLLTIPEPSTFLLLVIGAGVLMRANRQRRGKAPALHI